MGDDYFDLATVAADMNDCMPAGALETVTLFARTAGDNYGTGVAWPLTRRKPATRAGLEVGGGFAANERITFQLYVLAGQTTMPDEEFKIVDANGRAWFVKTVNVRMMSQIYDCDCTDGPG